MIFIVLLAGWLGIAGLFLSISSLTVWINTPDWLYGPQCTKNVYTLTEDAVQDALNKVVDGDILCLPRGSFYLTKPLVLPTRASYTILGRPE